VQHGFTFILEEDGLQRPQYFFAEMYGCMKPSKLKHLQTVHPQKAKTTEALFKIKQAQFHCRVKK
jgi:hypothetical protein